MEDNVKEKISAKNKKYVDNNLSLLSQAQEFRRNNIEEVDFIYDKAKRINMYLAEVKIMIVTANQIERDSLFSYFSKQSLHHVIKIAKKNFKLPLFSLKIYDTIKTLNIMLCCNLKNIIFVKVITCN